MDRIDEIRKRHSERKQRAIRKGQSPRSMPSRPSHYPDQSEKISTSKNNVPAFFLMKCMVSAALVLGIGILEKEQSFPFPKVKSTVQTALSNEFNFAGVSKWYESAFGAPLAILPIGKSTNHAQTTASATSSTVKASTDNFAVPVSGQVTKSFNQSKKGVTIQTSANSSVDSIDSGYVLSITNDKQTGQTVVIQHTNGDQSIYGELKSVSVKQYDFVKKKEKIGTVSTVNNQGVFYFAFKEGNKYVDPIQVISFD